MSRLFSPSFNLVALLGSSIAQDGPATVKQAAKILGKKRVFPADTVARAWHKPSFAVKATGYLVSTLKTCAEENAAGKADWCLTYHLGQNMAGIFRAIGDNPKTQPCFLPPCQLNKGYREVHILHPWSLAVESSWATAKFDEAYKLINFKPLFKGLDWEGQEAKIKLMGSCFERVPEAVFTEAVFSIFLISRGKIRIAEDWRHFGPHRMYAGRFIEAGMVFGKGHDGEGNSVVVCRKPDTI